MSIGNEHDIDTLRTATDPSVREIPDERHEGVETVRICPPQGGKQVPELFLPHFVRYLVNLTSYSPVVHQYSILILHVDSWLSGRRRVSLESRGDIEVH